MKSVLILASILTTMLVFADDPVQCTKGEDVLSFYFGEAHRRAPTLYGLRINGSFGGEGEQAFERMLQESERCAPIEVLPSALPHVFLCEGEMVATQGVFGQVFLSHGGIEVLKNVVAPAAGWTCNQ